MTPSRTKTPSIDDYIARQAPKAQSRLKRTRAAIRRAILGVEEKISYRMPAFTLDGRILVYIGAFTTHIGLYPPVRGDARLNKAIARYAGPKGNLRFPLDEPMPYELIVRVVKARAKRIGASGARRR
jgi:uncharacterized protein YdhG (YjbR/CyaY superfamily)